MRDDTDDADDGVAVDIDSLEQRIEALAAEVQRCRKLALAARLLIAAGAIGLAVLLFGLLAFTPEMLTAAIGAVLGGIVLAGSNASTRQQTERALRAAEAMRADLIGRLDMRLVGAERPTLH